LRIVNFDTAAAVLPTGLESLVERGGCRCAVRSRRRHLYEGELRVHESACSLDGSELGETETLGLACEDDGRKREGVNGKRESSMELSRKRFK
jgi:hypothetical protein